MSKRILYYTPIFPPRYSGATFQAISLARELRRSGHAITFLCLRESDGRRVPWAYDTATHDGFDVVSIPTRGYAEPYTLAKHAAIMLRLLCVLFLIRGRYDIIHSHNFQFPFAILGIAGRLLGRRTCCKVTMSSDLDYDGIGRRTGALYARMARSFDRILAISDEIAAQLRKRGFASRTIVSIPNGVDTDRFCPVPGGDRAALKTSLGLPDRTLVLFLGSITCRKGVDDLLEVWRRIHGQAPGAELLMLGPRSPAEGLSGETYCHDTALEFLARHGLAESVRIPGRVDDVVPYLRCAEVLVLPSKQEGMPNVVLEAMACGVPCVSNAVSGVSDIITPGVDGEIVAVDDVAGFAERLAALLADPERRAAYAERARATIETRFGLRSVAERYAALYATL